MKNCMKNHLNYQKKILQIWPQQSQKQIPKILPKKIPNPKNPINNLGFVSIQYCRKMKIKDSNRATPQKNTHTK